MRLTINSPLAPCQLPGSGQLSPYQAIGLVTDLAMNYIDSSVGDTLERLMPALNAGNAKVFFDKSSRPYGYVSWVTLPDTLQHSLLANTWNTSTDLAQFVNDNLGDKLWFFDLLCPIPAHSTCFEHSIIRRVITTVLSWCRTPVLNPTRPRGFGNDFIK